MIDEAATQSPPATDAQPSDARSWLDLGDLIEGLFSLLELFA